MPYNYALRGALVDLMAGRPVAGPNPKAAIRLIGNQARYANQARQWDQAAALADRVLAAYGRAQPRPEFVAPTVPNGQADPINWTLVRQVQDQVYARTHPGKAYA